jgi:hypothetical protein
VNTLFPARRRYRRGSSVLRQFLWFCLFSVLHFGYADPVPARLKQGSGHIFLVLRGEDGNILAAGESVQTVKGATVTTRTIFHFRDGSLDDETTVFEQSRNFRLLSDRHLQRGPAFPHPMEIQIEAASGKITVHEVDTDKTSTEKMKLPDDLANGIITQVLQNIPQDSAEIKVAYLLPTSKPRLASLVIARAGQDAYSLGGMHQTASKLEIKVQLSGVVGLVAPIIGKEPRTSYAWMAGGRVPMFIRLQTQFYEGAPLWTIEQTSPVWPEEK